MIDWFRVQCPLALKNPRGNSNRHKTADDVYATMKELLNPASKVTDMRTKQLGTKDRDSKRKVSLFLPISANCNYSTIASVGQSISNTAHVEIFSRWRWSLTTLKQLYTPRLSTLTASFQITANVRGGWNRPANDVFNSTSLALPIQEILKF